MCLISCIIFMNVTYNENSHKTKILHGTLGKGFEGCLPSTGVPSRPGLGAILRATGQNPFVSFYPATI